jgi:hypothetical protein
VLQGWADFSLAFQLLVASKNSGFLALDRGFDTREMFFVQVLGLNFEVNGLAVFDLLRYRRQEHSVLLCAFDLIELDGEDLRRKLSRNASRRLHVAAHPHDGIAFNEHFENDGAITSTPVRSAAKA